ncbi:MAG: serine--tRNA ligase [Candidatus Heimdallarchaeaceae archaeon]|jgi:seryl-tRNA synthetase
MFDIKLIRENPEMVRKNLERRQSPEVMKLLDKIIEDDKKYREMLKEVEDLKHKRNVLSRDIAELKRDGKDASSKMKEAQNIPEKIKSLEADFIKLKEKLDISLMSLPNLLHETVPFGKDDTENVETKKYGKEPKFDFEGKGHAEILTDMGLLDEERAAKVAGGGFYYLKGSLALLENAIIKYAVDYLVKKGYIFILPPHALRRDAYQGVVDLSDFESVMYKLEGEDLYLIATAEHPIGAMYWNETINKKDLPLKFVGLSTNFRKEIGAHGKYTRGTFRVHQFNKVEQFIFSSPEQSWDLHEELQKNSEELYEGLGLHYRIVNVCTGDIGTIAAKKYDTEVWMADGEFREVGSNSNCTDYQARRLNVKYREKEGQGPVGFVHTLNNTALATSRTLIGIVEQYQQKDGSVLIPKALQKYMGGMKKLEPLNS